MTHKNNVHVRKWKCDVIKKKKEMEKNLFDFLSSWYIFALFTRGEVSRIKQNFPENPGQKTKPRLLVEKKTKTPPPPDFIPIVIVN